MRVLMFGWEFPPHIAGGLGTACEGIVKGLAYNGVETLFVMPNASGDEDQSATTILNASDVAVQNVSSTVEEFINKVKHSRDRSQTTDCHSKRVGWHCSRSDHSRSPSCGKSPDVACRDWCLCD